MLSEWLLYCSCFVTRIQLYVAQCYVSVYDIVPVRHKHAAVYSKLKLLPLQGGNYALCTAAVTFVHTAFFHLPIPVSTNITTMNDSCCQNVASCHV
jgi:hypothetical protein